MTMVAKVPARSDDPEQDFELVVRVRVRGYGKTMHRKRLMAKLTKELRLQFGDVVIEEEAPLVWKAEA